MNSSARLTARKPKLQNAERTVLVSGYFRVLHPGHVRLLRFAKSLGDRLIVAVLSDDPNGSGAEIAGHQSLEAVQSLRMVDSAFVTQGPIEEVIQRLQPDIVVKGREHRFLINPEESILLKYGGRLVFGSGDSFVSEAELIKGEWNPPSNFPLELPHEFMSHHQISRERLASLVEQMGDLSVVVVGDVMVDEYVTCHALGMSREDPALVVTPLERRQFIGGAAIVAGHAARLGRVSSIFSIVGLDDQADFLRNQLSELGVDHFLSDDLGRPTTTKTRFRVGGKTLLKVSSLRHDPISESLQDQMYRDISSVVANSDLLIFSDFNYGSLPQPLVRRVTELGRSAGLKMAADSQSSSQIGDITRFIGMDILTPTEYEARVAMRNFEDGLVVLADLLREQASADAVLMTLAEDGLLIRGNSSVASVTTERLPALNPNPIDVAGAGDSLLVISSMARACGATFDEAALLGSIGAALQIAVTGNRPLSPESLMAAIGP